MMKRIEWKKTTLIAGLGLGMVMGGLLIHPGVSAQEAQKQRELKTETATKALSGRVKTFLKNDRGDIDGIALENGANIHFPPHMSAAITKLVAVGDQIEVRGREQTLPKGEVVIEAEQIGKGEQSVVIEHPKTSPGPKPPRGPQHRTEQPMSATGTIKDFVTNRHGDVDGFLLTDGTEVKLPPHQGNKLREFAKVGAEVAVEGHRHETPKGDIHLHANRIIDKTSGRALDREAPHSGRHVPPHAEILEELRAIRRLIESRQKP